MIFKTNPMSAIIITLITIFSSSSIPTNAQTTNNNTVITKSPPPPPSQLILHRDTLIKATQLLELESNPAAALKLLNDLLNSNPDPIIQRPALLLKNQITDTFSSRQYAWLNRTAVETVLLVPNESSFIAAINNWPDDRFYPILIEDAWFAPMFIRAYKPKQVVRWSLPLTNTTQKNNTSDTDKLIQTNLANTIEKHNQSIQRRDTKIPPPGLVVIDTTSTLRCAGLALALGRNQPAFISQSPWKHSRIIKSSELAMTNQKIMPMMMYWMLPQPDSWCALTLAIDLPYRYKFNKIEFDKLHNSLKKVWNKPNGVPGLQNLFATDDFLGRTPNSTRLAVVGRLTGNPTQSIYQAMCSLFLQPSNILLFDNYSSKTNFFGQYKLHHTANILSKTHNTKLVEKELVLPAMLRKLTRPHSPYDMLWLNSSGGGYYFNLAKQAHGHPDDIPLNTPASYYVIHSGSAVDPYNPHTIAGRAILGGAFWYFGSMSEPFLMAFMRPTGMAHKTLAQTPLAFTTRQLPHNPIYYPWKLFVVGDPLYTIRKQPAKRSNDRPPLNSTPLPAPLPLNSPLTNPPTKSSNPLPPSQQLQLAALHNLHISPQLALDTLAQPDSATPSQLARAAWSLATQHQFKPLADLPTKTINAHPIVKAMVWRALIYQINTHLADNDTTTAQIYITRALQLALERETLTTLLQKWYSAMTNTNQQTKATDFLNDQTAKKLPHFAKQAIKKTLEPSPTTP